MMHLATQDSPAILRIQAISLGQPVFERAGLCRVRDVGGAIRRFKCNRCRASYRSVIDPRLAHVHRHRRVLVRQMEEAARRPDRHRVRRIEAEAMPREQLLRLAIVTLGPELALAAYPEIAALDPS